MTDDQFNEIRRLLMKQTSVLDNILEHLQGAPSEYKVEIEDIKNGIIEANTTLNEISQNTSGS